MPMDNNLRMPYQKKLESAFEDGLFDQVLATIHHPIFCINAAQSITHCNKEFSDLIGFSKDHILGKHPSDLFMVFYTPHESHTGIITKFDPYVQQVTPTHKKNTFGIKAHCLLEDAQVLGAIFTVTPVTSLSEPEAAQSVLFKYTELMLQINQSMLEVTSEQDLLDLIMRELYLIFGHQECGCILINKDNHLKMVSQVGYTPEAMLHFDIETERSYFWRYANGNINKVYRINQIDLIEQEDYTKVAASKSGQDMLSSISAPIIIDGSLYGLINFDSPRVNAFTEEQVAIMEYVRTQLSIAIKNMKL